MGVSNRITCKCGNQMIWVEDKKFTKNPCPECGRRYIGKYNPKTLTIEPIEIKGNVQKLFKPYIVNRKDGQCQILIPLVELDEFCELLEIFYIEKYGEIK